MSDTYPFRKSYPRVAMMQPRQDGRSGNVSADAVAFDQHGDAPSLEVERPHHSIETWTVFCPTPQQLRMQKRISLQPKPLAAS